MWRLLSKDSSPKLILGARSSVFLPIKNLGLVIVDEEHDTSFKQEDRCPYNARDVAIKRASLLNIPIVLGSATPSLETYYSLKETKGYLPMKERVGICSFPNLSLIDIRNESYGDHYPLASKTLDKIKYALDKKEQILVFVNRLGFARFIQCSACGYSFECSNCSTTLKYYKSKEELSCSYCEYKIPPPKSVQNATTSI